MTLKFFIDECLTPSLVAVAKERELFAVYGPYVGKAGWQDWSVAEFAFGNDLIVVTNNRRDFLEEYAGMELRAEGRQTEPDRVVLGSRGFFDCDG